MITMAPLPTWRQLLIRNKKISGPIDTIWGNSQNSLYFSRGADALKCITMYYQKRINNKKICIYIPEYFCNETLTAFREYCSIVYYPINQTFNPIYKECNKLAKLQKPDLFLLVHYFGHPANAAEAYNFCKQNGSELIEDAAHVLYPTKGIGEKGIFTLFSPHKLLPVPDGSILVINENNSLFKELSITFDSFKQFKATVEHNQSNIGLFQWKIKKIVQKLLIIKKPSYRQGRIPASDAVKTDTSIFPISGYSFYVLSKYYKKADIVKLGEERKYKYKIWNYLIEKNYNVRSLFDESNDWIPYIAGYIDENHTSRDRYIKAINSRWHIADTWPSLPDEILSTPSSYANELQKRIIICSLHHSLPISEILKIFKDTFFLSDSASLTDRLGNGSIEVQQDCDINLIQSNEYINAKKRISKWKTEQIELFKNGVLIGYYNCLIKNYGLKIARINRGPILFNSVELTYEDKYHLLRTIKKRYGLKKGYVLFFAPNMDLTGENIELMERLKYKYRNTHWSSGKILLSQSEEDLKKNLSSKWRNLLKAADKYDCQIVIDDQNIYLDSLMELHTADKQKRNYKDSGDAIVKELGALKCIVSYIAMDHDSKILSFVMIVLHGRTSCTYLIGWNSDWGYKYNLNRKLLWNALVDMKSRGIQYFDLGGIDMINTPQVASFKLGMNSDLYELLGEYIAI